MTMMMIIIVANPNLFLCLCLAFKFRKPTQARETKEVFYLAKSDRHRQTHRHKPRAPRPVTEIDVPVQVSPKSVVPV